MPRLSHNERHQAIGMLRGGMSARRVANTFNVHESTIGRLRTRFEASNDVLDLPRTGRPRVTTARQDRVIRLRHLRDRQRSASHTAAETPGTHNNRISDQTVRRRLHEVNLRARRPLFGLMLTDVRRRRRRDWAQNHQNWTLRQWSNVMFSDESRFCLSHADGRVRVWRRVGERYSDAAVLQRDRWGGGSLMVWAGITAAGRTELIHVNGNLTGARYLDEILRPVVLPFVRRHNVTFQQDNARPHTARICTAFITQENIPTLPWPAFSPDLSPIEHLWDVLDRRIRNREPQPGNIPQLLQALQEEWEAIPQNQIRRLVNSMRRRIAAVIQARGGHTRY